MVAGAAGADLAEVQAVKAAAQAIPLVEAADPVAVGVDSEAGAEDLVVAVGVERAGGQAIAPG